jgi:superfamily II DNA or RNA helicase
MVRPEFLILQNQSLYVRQTGLTTHLSAELKRCSEIQVSRYVRDQRVPYTETCWREYQDTLGNSYVVFPRYLLQHVENLSHWVDKWPEDKKSPLNAHHMPPARSFTFEGTLDNGRRKQKDASDAIVTALQTIGGAVLCMPPGTGKTTTTCHIMSRIQTSVVVLTHTSELMSQWKERITQFLPGARIGQYSTQTPVACADYDVVLAMMQTSSQEKTPPMTGVGLVVVDEAHHICAEMLRHCLDKFNAPYTLGLTATPTRKDGRTDLLFYFLGPMGFELHVPYTLPVHVLTLVHHDPKLTNKPKYASALSHLTMNVKRIHAALATAFAKIPDISKRHVLILASRTAMVGCALAYVRDHLALQYDIDPDAVQKLVAGKKEENAKIKSCARVMLATDVLVSEGFDCPRLDTLILLTHSGDSVQTYGRVMRSCEDKVVPVTIVEIQDTQSSVMNALYFKRVSLIRRGFAPDCPFTDQSITEQRVTIE